MQTETSFFDGHSIHFLNSLKRTVFSKPLYAVVLIIFSACLSTSQVLGLWLDGEMASSCFWVFWGLTLLVFIIATLVAHMVLYFQYEVGEAETNKGEAGEVLAASAVATKARVSLKAWVIISVVLLISFTITYLMNFPGTYSNDSLDSINIALGQASLSNAHPVLYTAFVALFVHIGLAFGNIEIGLVLYCIVQMILCATVLSYTCCWLKKMGAPTLAVLAAVVFFTFNPIIARYSFTMWKDIPFSLCFILVVLLLFELVLTPKHFLVSKQRCVTLALFVLLSCLLRNNALYALLLTVIVLAITFRRIFIAWVPSAVAVVLAFVITGPIYTAAGVEPSPFRESVGIPIQQIAAVLSEDADINDQEKAMLSNMVDLEAAAQAYTPTSSNPVKYHESFNDEWLNTHKGEFLTTWLEIGLKNPKLYLKAWLWETRGYWDIQTQDHIVVGPTGYTDDGRNLIYDVTGLSLTGGDASSQYDGLRMSTVASPLFCLAWAVWFVAVALVLRFISKQRRAALPLIPFVGLWATLMIAAPYYCEFRYLYALHLALPVIIITMFLKSNTATNDTNETGEAASHGASGKVAGPCGVNVAKQE